VIYASGGILTNTVLIKMLKNLSILYGFLLSVATSAEGSELGSLAFGNAKALEHASENIGKYRSKNDRINGLLKTSSVVKIFLLKIKEDDYALAIATNSYWSWPGNNSFLAILLDSKMDPVDCVLVGGQQVFKTAYFKKAEQELVTYARARRGGIYTQSVKVSTSGLLVAEATHSEEIDFGYEISFPTSSSKKKASEQDGADQPATAVESKPEGDEKSKLETKVRPQ
jgi:hypothetical protein